MGETKIDGLFIHFRSNIHFMLYSNVVYAFVINHGKHAAFYNRTLQLFYFWSIL